MGKGKRRGRKTLPSAGSRTLSSKESKKGRGRDDRKFKEVGGGFSRGEENGMVTFQELVGQAEIRDKQIQKTNCSRLQRRRNRRGKEGILSGRKQREKRG